MPKKKQKSNVPKKPPHRPRKVIDWKLIDDLLEIAATGEEIAAVLKISYDTIERACKREHGIAFADYIKNGISNFKVSLRRSMRRSAFGIPKRDSNGEVIGWIQAPYPPMQMFLAKNYLGMKDVIMQSNVEIPFDNIGKEEQARLAEEAANIILGKQGKT